MADRTEIEGRFMRALGTVLLLAMLAASGPGCAMFGKKEGSAERHGPFAHWFKKKDTSANPPPPRWPDPLTGSPGTMPPPVPPTASVQPPAPQAVLAGQVVDAHMQGVNNSFVQLIRKGDANDGAAPIDVATVDGGYFTVKDLKSGSEYQLIARTRRGDKMLAGKVYRWAPDPHVVIQVKEELATGDIPPLPESTEKKEAKPAPSSSLEQRPPATATWTPAPAAPTATVEVELPTKLTVPAPAALSPGFANTPNTPWPPTLQIGPKKSASPPANTVPPALPTPNDLQSRLSAMVPSCVLVDNKVHILAFKDVGDQTWNFFKDRKGRVVLLDFWMPKCPPCLQTMATLTQMNTKYGPQGLEVVGVYMDSGPVADQAERAKKTCYQLRTNYRQVLGQEDRTRLREQFRFQNCPTMVLLDAQGHILWRHEGALDQAVLEQVLQKHLAPKAF